MKIGPGYLAQARSHAHPYANETENRFSRDGDQFHYLWAARRCLQLLSIQSDLLAISIEGSSRQESGSESPARAGEEVIDIAEYFGSEEIKNARLVRYLISNNYS